MESKELDRLGTLVDQARLLQEKIEQTKQLLKRIEKPFMLSVSIRPDTEEEYLSIIDDPDGEDDGELLHLPIYTLLQARLQQAEKEFASL